jgi:diaminohydroxyphosphoribosylaminopyrimidine deaminase / 5-amino-6-(5-phosphoribosylamino)uracil reductase
MGSDELLMRRALELARRGLGTTWPNPMVGAVLVRDGQVIGEGYHRFAGGPHAEIDALQQCSVDPTGATMYVTLEPCCHHARTGPCSRAVIDAGIRRVVVGTLDPNPKVAGCGVTAMRDTGIGVTVGVLPVACTELNAVYFTARARRRPHITLKSATDLYGRTATRTGESQWITGEAGRAHAHRQRSLTQAIAVGSGTALADNPRLTARGGGSAHRSPVRVLFDSRLSVPANFNLFADDGVPVLVYTTARGLEAPASGAPDHRAEVVVCGDGPRVDLALAMADLDRREVVDLLVEGGATLAGAMVDAGLFDRVMLYIAARVIGGDEAPGPLKGRGVDQLAATAAMEFTDIERLGTDLVLTARRPLEVPCSRV